VRAHGAGFVAYRWQWKDDPGRIVPKLSYVKGFKPWGWIIGTGIYIDDVREEIRAATGKLFAASLGILALVSLLVAAILSGHYRDQKRRREAEALLSASEERYRLLAESSGELILLSFEGEPLFANARPLSCRYAPEFAAPLGGRSSADGRQAPAAAPRRLLAGGGAPRRFETRPFEGRSDPPGRRPLAIERPDRRGFSFIAWNPPATEARPRPRPPARRDAGRPPPLRAARRLAPAPDGALLRDGHGGRALAATAGRASTSSRRTRPAPRSPPDRAALLGAPRARQRARPLAASAPRRPPSSTRHLARRRPPRLGRNGGAARRATGRPSAPSAGDRPGRPAR
jgi:hypothetical protein